MERKIWFSDLKKLLQNNFVLEERYICIGILNTGTFKGFISNIISDFVFENSSKTHTLWIFST